MTDLLAPPLEFHPAVAEWFAGRFPDGPTVPQRGGWQHIADGAGTIVEKE